MNKKNKNKWKYIRNPDFSTAFRIPIFLSIDFNCETDVYTPKSTRAIQQWIGMKFIDYNGITVWAGKNLHSIGKHLPEI